MQHKDETYQATYWIKESLVLVVKGIVLSDIRLIAVAKHSLFTDVDVSLKRTDLNDSTVLQFEISDTNDHKAHQSMVLSVFKRQA